MEIKIANQQVVAFIHAMSQLHQYSCHISQSKKWVKKQTKHTNNICAVKI